MCSGNSFVLQVELPFVKMRTGRLCELRGAGNAHFSLWERIYPRTGRGAGRMPVEPCEWLFAAEVGFAID